MNRKLKGIASLFMVSLSFLIQPLRYFSFISLLNILNQTVAAQAKTACDSSQDCQKSFAHQNNVVAGKNIQYILSPGIADPTPKEMQYSEYFRPSELERFLVTQSNKQLMVKSTALNADWKSVGLQDQGKILARQVNDMTQDPETKTILLGHSMGGLRIREAVQFHREQNQNLEKNVAGIITIGTPHDGAPIINNGGAGAAYMAGTFGEVLGGFTGIPLQYLGKASGMFLGEKAFTDTLESPSGQDLSKGSPFLKRLNTPAPEHKIPSNVAIMEVIGLNNDVDHLAASMSNLSPKTVATLRVNMGRVSALVSVMAVAAAFWTFGATLPLAYALLKVAKLLFELPVFWQKYIVGSSEGDGVVPVESQYFPEPEHVGGGQRVRLLMPNSTHSGRFSEYTVSQRSDSQSFTQALRNFQSIVLSSPSPSDSRQP